MFVKKGSGHFSPIGAYHAEKDMVLIMDVARFKYSPHWVQLLTLFQAMTSIDNETQRSRGYIVLRPHSTPSLLFRFRSSAQEWKIQLNQLFTAFQAHPPASWTELSKLILENFLELFSLCKEKLKNISSEHQEYLNTLKIQIENTQTYQTAKASSSYLSEKELELISLFLLR